MTAQIKLVPVKMKNVDKPQENNINTLALPTSAVLTCTVKKFEEMLELDLDEPNEIIIIVLCPIKYLFDTVKIDSEDEIFLFMYNRKLYQAIDENTYELFKEMYKTKICKPIQDKDMQDLMRLCDNMCQNTTSRLTGVFK